MTSDYEFERLSLLQKIADNRYAGMEITPNDKKMSEYFKQTFDFHSFPEDFYTVSAMKYKEKIETHVFFSKISQLPKGALLHNHLYDSIDADWLIEQLENPHIYEETIELFGQTMKILTYNEQPSHDFPRICDLKREYLKLHNEAEWNLEIKKKLCLFPAETQQISGNKEAWLVFFPKLFYAFFLIHYKSFYFLNIMHAFRECIREKIFRFETRAILGLVRDKNFKEISIEEQLELFVKALKEVRVETPQFSCGIIVSIKRNFDDATIKKCISEAFLAKTRFGDLIVGVDFDGDENKFRKFRELAPVISQSLRENQEKFGVSLPLVLHCGESCEFSNENPIDGLLLDSKRLGHGLNLVKFPYLMQFIKEKGVCIEINPISNQILKNCLDLRWHPAIIYLGMGIKIAISNDDPMIYGTKGVSMTYSWRVRRLSLI